MPLAIEFADHDKITTLQRVRGVRQRNNYGVKTNIHT